MMKKFDAERTLQARRPVVYHSVAEQDVAGVTPAPGSERARSILIVPMRAGERVLGLVVLVFAVSRGNIVVGLLGFVCMLGGTAYAVSSQRRGPLGVVNQAGGVRPPVKGKARSKAGFLQRLEERWDRRRDQGLGG